MNEFLVAEFADEFFPGVFFHVDGEVGRLCEGFVAYVASERTVACVGFQVGVEDVTAGEFFFAVVAGERFLSRVRSENKKKIVGDDEFLRNLF